MKLFLRSRRDQIIRHVFAFILSLSLFLFFFFLLSAIVGEIQSFSWPILLVGILMRERGPNQGRLNFY